MQVQYIVSENDRKDCNLLDVLKKLCFPYLGRTQAEGVQEHSAEKNIWTKDEKSNRTLEKNP
jgi:hypothetical protein